MAIIIYLVTVLMERTTSLKLSNRPVRTRMPGGVAGVPPTGGPLCRLVQVCSWVGQLPT
jgi:hypothetical protein